MFDRRLELLEVNEEEDSVVVAHELVADSLQPHSVNGRSHQPPVSLFRARWGMLVFLISPTENLAYEVIHNFINNPCCYMCILLMCTLSGYLRGYGGGL